MIQIRIKTTDFVEKQLKRSYSELAINVEKAIYRAAALVQADAIRGIQRGKKTGREYTRRGVTHQASKAGEYPASDTGRLAGSIRINRGMLKADIGTDVIYAKYLEPDDVSAKSRIEPRPFLEPSYLKNKEKIGILIDEAIKEAFEI